VSGSGKWICGPAPDPNATARVFCFPYAGGGAAAFLPWRPLFTPHGIDFCCVQLPGRETRFGEALVSSMPELVRAICSGLEAHLARPFSLFGHSMGAIVAYEVACELRRRGGPMPEWLFVSGSLAPHRRDAESLHTLPTAQFIDTLVRRYNGIPPEILANQELLDLTVPILRADFALLELHRRDTATALPVKFAVFGGDADPSVRPDALDLWREATNDQQAFRTRLFPGDHFFIHELRAALAEEIVGCHRS
jgi:medium-chain acyl-[acyl-carrier-protein] hydrolase